MREPEQASRAASRSYVPSGYRQSVVTAITVILGFSMAFLRFWGIENPGEWTLTAVLAALFIAAGIALQLVALFRALDVRDEDLVHYRVTVRLFRAGVIIVIAGVVASIFSAA